VTNIGDRVNVVMGSDGKYYCKSSPSVSIGDTVQVFMGSDGKYYASKSGNPNIGSNVLVSMDSNGEYIAHISSTTIVPPVYDTKSFLFFCGGNEVVYTAWQYTKSSVTKWCIEKRDPITLEIIDLIAPYTGFYFSTPSIQVLKLGGTYRYLINGSNFPTFDYYDSLNGYAYAFSKTIPEDNGFYSCGMAGDIFTKFGDGAINGWVYKYNITNESTIGTFYYGNALTVGFSGNSSILYAHRGRFDNVMTKRDFPSGSNYSTGDGDVGTFFMDSIIGYESLVPTDIGSNTCTGYRWDPTTLTRTAL
jgi:hypothetical protein